MSRCTHTRCAPRAPGQTLPFPEFFTFKAAQLARRQRFFLFRQSSPYRIGGQTDKVARRHKVLAAAALWGACAWFVSLDVDFLVTNLRNAPHWVLQGFRALFMGVSVALGYVMYRQQRLFVSRQRHSIAQLDGSICLKCRLEARNMPRSGSRFADFLPICSPLPMKI